MATRDQLFADIDSMDPDRFAAHLAEGVTMRFGNAGPVVGRSAVREVWAGFCAGVDGVSHALVQQWRADDTAVVHSDVTYTRRDATTVTVPAVTIYREGAAGIEDYRVVIDLAPLFAPAEQPAEQPAEPPAEPPAEQPVAAGTAAAG